MQLKGLSLESCSVLERYKSLETEARAFQQFDGSFISS